MSETPQLTETCVRNKNFWSMTEKMNFKLVLKTVSELSYSIFHWMGQL